MRCSFTFEWCRLSWQSTRSGQRTECCAVVTLKVQLKGVSQVSYSASLRANRFGQGLNAALWCFLGAMKGLHCQQMALAKYSIAYCTVVSHVKITKKMHGDARIDCWQISLCDVNMPLLWVPLWGRFSTCPSRESVTHVWKTCDCILTHQDRKIRLSISSKPGLQPLIISLLQVAVFLW